jgi:anaerobic selenocysteine-containing dehydrogenase
MNKLTSTRVSEPWQVEIMREIYNDNLTTLSTKPLPYREYDEQQEWWQQNKDTVDAYLYRSPEDSDHYVGFMALRDRGGFHTPIMAFRKIDWGKGYGKEATYDYIAKAKGPLAGTQLKSNIAICKINVAVGWEVLTEKETSNGTIQLIYHPGIHREELRSHPALASILAYLEISRSDLPHL